MVVLSKDVPKSVPYTNEIHDQVVQRIGAIEDALTDKRVFFSVRDGDKKWKLAYAPETTVGQVKARIFVPLCRAARCSIARVMCNAVLQRTKGPHLTDDQRIGDLGIHGKTLMLTFRGVGGAGPNPEAEIANQQRGLFVQMMMCKLPGQTPKQRDKNVNTYNLMVDELRLLYRDEGVIADTLPDGTADERIVNPKEITALGDGKIVEKESLPKRHRKARSGGGGGSSSRDGGGGGDDHDLAIDELCTDRSNGAFWDAASKDPSKDPRNKPLGPQFIPDALMQARIRAQPELNSSGDPDFEITEDNRDLFAGTRCIDPSLSGLDDPKYHDVVQRIGKDFFMGPKQEEVIRRNSKDGKQFISVGSCFLNAVPVDDWEVSVVNILLGRAQSGKSYEGVLDCWKKFFVDACFPMYYCRTQGGLNDVQEMLADFHNFNDDLNTYLVKLRNDAPRMYGWLTDEEIAKFKLQPRLTRARAGSAHAVMKGVEVEVVDCSAVSAEWGEQVAREAEQNPSAPIQKAVRLTRPQVIIGLMNPASMNNFIRNGCVLTDVIGDNANPTKLNLDGEGFLVNREELQTALFKCENKSKRFSPFTLLCGVMHHEVSLNSHKGKQKSKKVVFHSAYAPACWDTSRPYDKGVNVKRARLARFVDEMDASTSDKKVHKTGELVHDSKEMRGIANQALDKTYESACAMRKDVRSRGQGVKDIERELERLAELKQRILDGEEEGDVMEVDSMRADAVRAHRLSAEGRSAAAAARAGAAGADLTPSDGEGDEEEDEDEDENDYDEEGEEEEEYEEVEAEVVEGASGDDERAERVRKVQDEIDANERKLREQQGRMDEANDRLSQEVRKATAGHITGMQSAAMYTVGCSATIFGCLQAHRGGKTQTRLTMLPTPDAYNDFVLKDEATGEYRKLIDPSKRAKRMGDVQIIEAPINPIEFTNMALSENRNGYLRTWMVKNGKGRMEGGRFIPSEGNPIGKPNVKGTFTVYDKWYKYPEGEDPPATHVPWIAEMMQDLAMQKYDQHHRSHNSFKRTGSMFELLLDKLQGQRKALKRIRRGAQGLIITNETRLQKTKKRLISDLFKHAKPELMKDVCMYSYAGECLSLIFPPDSEFEDLLAHVLDHTDTHLDELREYLRGDATMHHTRTEKGGNRDTKLGNKWLAQHYIAPIRDVLSEFVQRDPSTAEPDAEYKARAKKALEDGDPAPLQRKGKIKFETDVMDVVHPQTGEVMEPIQLRRLDFRIGKSAPQPRYLATLFTLIDANRFAFQGDRMLPMPYVGMTKEVGGRAQRYMDHGHRSRIQAQCHTFEIMPNKKLGISMATALQEAQRLLGFDEIERFYDNYATTHPNMWGEHMDDWVPQVYISTKDFVPLIRNALQSQVEWARMLAKELHDPQRHDAAANFTTRRPETDEEYAARQKESPTDCFARVIGNQVKWCLMETIRIWDEEGRSAKSADMPTFPGHQYPNLYAWYSAEVNRAPTTAARLLRHSNQDKSESELRRLCTSYAHDLIDAEIEAARAASARRDNEDDEYDEDYESPIARKYREKHDELMQKYGSVEGDAQYEAILKRVHKQTQDLFIGKIPIPIFSAVHAPGGALEERDRAEAERVEQRLQEMYAGRVTVQAQYELARGKGFAWHHQRRSQKAKDQWYVDQAALMHAEEVPPNGGPVHLHGYKKPRITAWYNKKHGLGKRGGGGGGDGGKRPAEWYAEAAKRLKENEDGNHFKTNALMFKVYPALEADYKAFKKYLVTHRYKDAPTANNYVRLFIGLKAMMNEQFVRLCKSGDDSHSTGAAPKDGGMSNEEANDLVYESMREECGYRIHVDDFLAMDEEAQAVLMTKYTKIGKANASYEGNARTNLNEFRQYLDDRANNRIGPAPPPVSGSPTAGSSGAGKRRADSPPPGLTAAEQLQIEEEELLDAQQRSMQENFSRDRKRLRRSNPWANGGSSLGDDESDSED